MQPFERLRALARWSDEGSDDAGLVSEAAECLTGFEGDPAGLVVACRRLLAHHPASGALWWLCARVLCAPDGAEAAWDAWQLLHEDATSARLAALLPFPHDRPVAVLGWPERTAAALADRIDLDVVVVPTRAPDAQLRLRLRRTQGSVRLLAEHALTDAKPSHLLVETAAIAPAGAVVPSGAGELMADANAGGAAVWLVAGTGRFLPARLFDALAAAVHADGTVEIVDLAAVDRVAGPTGLDAADRVLRRVDCPVAPELLRIAEA